MDLDLNKKQGIYIELDALLDTRLSTLFQMEGVDLSTILDNGYFTRSKEEFYGIPKEAFDSEYKLRDKITLKDAVITKSIVFIRELIVSMIKQATETPMHTGPKLIVNVYPYQLSKEETEAIIKGIAAASGQLCDVEAVNMPPDRLTPSYCKDNLAIMFIYNYSVWLEAQAKNFETIRCSDITVIVPGIYFVREPTKEELSELLDKFMHPLKGIELISAPFINLKLYDIDLFCANTPKKS